MENTVLIKKYLLIFFFCCFGTLSWAHNINLKFKEGKFKILQLTDIHWNQGEAFKLRNDSTIVLIQELLKTEKPDLVVITGDVVVSSGAIEGWKEVTKPMVEAKVPFAVTFGNHDTEADITTAQALKLLKTIPYNLTSNDDPKISGVGNYTLPVWSSDGKKEKWVLYFFDSHAYPKDKIFGTYDWIKYDQIEWYRKTSDKNTRRNGKTLPSLAFFHIPLPEYETDKKVSTILGHDNEKVCSPDLNSGLMGAFLDKRDVMGIFTGHDHNNDYLLDLQGRICLAYGRKTGYVSAYNEVLKRGARIIVLHENDRGFDTYLRNLKSSSLYYTFEQKQDK